MWAASVAVVSDRVFPEAALSDAAFGDALDVVREDDAGVSVDGGAGACVVDGIAEAAIWVVRRWDWRSSRVVVKT